ncbi:MAG TPA: hypothetical protein ENL02_00925 [Epsilonproteobacteria bacterium]|nr:hypothetical protein [Campylobacterota bacterium]
MQPTTLYFVLTRHHAADAAGAPFTYLETRYVCTSRKEAEMKKTSLGGNALLRSKIYIGFPNGLER